jgi:predicted CXXCH cytochrome family protein
MFLAVAVSCDEVERHRVLTFFFDGVPPLYDETGDANDVNDVNDVNLADVQQPEAEPAWFGHKPYRVCKNCHDMSKKPGSIRPDFTKLPPALCYDCHPESDYSGSTDHVHGPVAVADCLFCHEHHRSEHKHLLKEAVPDLCYQCHDKEGIGAIEDHSLETYSACLDCHEGHSSPSKGLLREDRQTETGQNQGL